MIHTDVQIAEAKALIRGAEIALGCALSTGQRVNLLLSNVGWLGSAIEAQNFLHDLVGDSDRFTAGDWNARTFLVCSHGGLQICHTGVGSGIKDPHECEANARLIAQAPAMLRLLRHFTGKNSPIRLPEREAIESIEKAVRG